MQQLTRFIIILLITFLFGSVHNQAKPLVDITQVSHQTKIKTKAQIKTIRLATVSIISIPTPAPVALTSNIVANCGDNTYANYIYNHESTCNPQAENPGGCLGIGQACPGEKLLAVCPNLDYACENTFFTNYAVTTYGSWEAAYNHEISDGWW